MRDYLFRAIRLVWYVIFRPNVISISGVKINISHNHIPWDVRRHFYAGSYERDEITVVEDLVDESDIVLEVGAGIGFVSAYVAKKIGGDRVFAFEVNPFMQEKIRENYRLNNVSPNLSSLFLSDKMGERDFFVDKSFWSSSSVHRPERDTTQVKVKTVDVNEVLSKINPTALIIDIEGGELDLIPQIDFEKHSIKKVMIELHPGIIGKREASVILLKLIESGFSIDFFYTQKNVVYLDR